MHPLGNLCWLRAASAALLLASAACESDFPVLLPATTSPAAELQGYELLARFAHVTDTHVVDEESPARFASAHELVSSAWRPYEAYSTQILDGILRTVNRIHASGRTIDFLMHTGDACDNSQSNELAWVLGVFDGGEINPRTGPDDRPADSRPDTLLDPHATFTAQGLYRRGVHGGLPSIPWYSVLGNHDRHAIGVFPIFQDAWGRHTSPLPLSQRPGVLLPTVLDPLALFAHGNVTPAEPGPPCLFELPRFVWPNPGRAYFDRREYIRAMFDTTTEPAGHGFSVATSRDRKGAEGWYSVSLSRGLRLIGLDTTDAGHAIEGFVYSEGSILAEQAAFLRAELDAARAPGGTGHRGDAPPQQLAVGGLRLRPDRLVLPRAARRLRQCRAAHRRPRTSQRRDGPRGVPGDRDLLDARRPPGWAADRDLAKSRGRLGRHRL